MQLYSLEEKEEEILIRIQNSFNKIDVGNQKAIEAFLKNSRDCNRRNFTAILVKIITTENNFSNPLSFK